MSGVQRRQHVHDVFVSYAKSDREWVAAEVFRRLDDRGITYIDEGRFTLGGMLFNELERAIGTSRRILLVITGRYLADAWPQFHVGAAFGNMMRTGQTRIIPARKEECELPSILGAIAGIDLYADGEKSWNRLLTTLSSALDGNGAGQGVAAAPPQVTSLQSAGSGLNELAELLTRSGMRERIGKANFGVLGAQITELSNYKRIHDLFQQLEDAANVIGNLGAVPTDALVVWESLQLLLDQGVQIERRLVEAAGKIAFAGRDDLWVKKLRRGHDDIQNGIVATESANVVKGCALVASVLRTVPARINVAMVTLVRGLRLASIEEALTVGLSLLGDKPAEANPARALLEEGRQQVSEFDAMLRSSLHRHDVFQEIDGELRRIEVSDPSDFVHDSAWPDIDALTISLCETRPEAHCTGLLIALTELRQSLASSDFAATRRKFHAFRSAVNRAFNEEDRRLLGICTELENTVGKPLHMLVTRLQEL
jgi:hypothetical protein